MAQQIPYRGMTISAAYDVVEQRYEESVKMAEHWRTKNRRSVDLCYQAAALLDEAGFTVPVLEKYEVDGFYLRIERADLPRVYRTLGKLALYGKQLQDAKTRMIEVTLEAVDYPCVKVHYLQKLPCKCKIVTQRENAYRRKVLVCGTA